MNPALVAAFSNALPAELRAVVSGRATLAEELAEAAATVSVRYPELGLVEAIFVEALAARLESAETNLAEHAADCYLAEVSGRGDPKALAIFQQHLGPDLDRAIGKSPTLGLSAAEFRQLVLERLFVADGERPPRIFGYRGRGPLRGWVRVMAARLVIDLARRRDDATEPNDELAKRIGTTGEPELGYLRHAYGAALAPAFEEALARLTTRQRNLLRQRYLHTIAIDRLATIYGVHRATIFDWLDKARVALLGHIRSALAARIPGQELDSVVALLGSDLDLSVRRMLDASLEEETRPA